MQTELVLGSQILTHWIIYSKQGHVFFFFLEVYSIWERFLNEPFKILHYISWSFTVKSDEKKNSD